MNNLLKYFSQLEIENNLSFSSHEVLNNCVFGLDDVNLKIFVVTRNASFYGSFIIDLNNVIACTVKKSYGSINVGGLKDHKLEHYLEKIALHFELDHKPPVEIIFYQNSNNHVSEIQVLEQKAKHWETVLTKMHTPIRISA